VIKLIDNIWRRKLYAPTKFDLTAAQGHPSHSKVIDLGVNIESPCTTSYYSH